MILSGTQFECNMMVTIICPKTHCMILSEISEDCNSTLALRLSSNCTQPSGEHTPKNSSD